MTRQLSTLDRKQGRSFWKKWADHIHQVPAPCIWSHSFLVMDNELHGSTKSNFDYFFVKDLVRKYDQLKEAISSGKAKIIEETSGWRNDVKFLYHLHMTSVTSLRNKISSFCALQQIFNIRNARWNSCAILDPLTFMLMSKTWIKFCKVCLFIFYP